MKVEGNKKNYDVHRYVCAQVHGPAPEGAVAAHSCDNKLCINPNHLAWETQAKNMADMSLRGRAVGGGRGRQRLTADDVNYIRTSGESLLKLGVKYGMEPSHIGRVRRGEAFKCQ